MTQYDRIQNGSATPASIAQEIKDKTATLMHYKKLPGHVLVEEFMVPYYPADLGDLSKRTRIPYNKLQGLIRGTVKIDERMAVALGDFFSDGSNYGKDYWLDLQARYERGEAI